MYPNYSNYSPYPSLENQMSPVNQTMPTYPANYQETDEFGDRIGFLAPFLLGGITGGLLAPAFYPRPYYPYPPYYYGPYPRYY